MYDVCQDGGTPLFVACQCNHLEVVEELVSNGADVHSQMVDGASPLFISSQNGHLRMVQYLIGKGAKPGMARKVCTRKSLSGIVVVILYIHRHYEVHKNMLIVVRKYAKICEK